MVFQNVSGIKQSLMGINSRLPFCFNPSCKSSTSFVHLEAENFAYSKSAVSFRLSQFGLRQLEMIMLKVCYRFSIGLGLDFDWAIKIHALI